MSAKKVTKVELIFKPFPPYRIRIYRKGGNVRNYNIGRDRFIAIQEWLNHNYQMEMSKIVSGRWFVVSYARPNQDVINMLYAQRATYRKALVAVLQLLSQFKNSTWLNTVDKVETIIDTALGVKGE